MATTKINIEFFRSCKQTELKFFKNYQGDKLKMITKEMHLNSVKMLREDRHSNVEAFLLNAINVYDYDRTNSSLNVLFECDRLIEFCKRSDDDYSDDFVDNQYFFNMLYYVRRLLDVNDDFEFEFEVNERFQPDYYIQITHDQPIYRPAVQFYMYNKNQPENKQLVTATDERDIDVEGLMFVAQSYSSDDDGDYDSNNWNLGFRCSCHNLHRRHRCMYLRTPEWRSIDQLTGEMPADLYRKITSAVTRATLAILFSKTMNRRDKMIVKRDVTSNQYLVMAIYCPDQAFGPYEENIIFLQRLYRLRELMGNDEDMGVKPMIPSYTAEEGDTVVEETIEEPSVLKKLMNGLKEAYSTIKEWSQLTYEHVKSMASTVIDFFVKGFRSISSIFESLIDKLINAAAGYVWRAIFEKLKMVTKAALDWGILVFAMTTASILAVGCARIVSERFLDFIIKFVTPGKQVKKIEKFQAQSLEPTTAGLGYVYAFLAVVFGKFTGHDKKAMKERLQYLAALIAGGTIAATASRFAFGILPYALQDALIYKFAPAWYQEERRMQTWKDQAEMLFKMSKVTKVVTSKEYYSKLNDCLKAGPKLMEKLTNAKNKSYYLALMGKLLTISSYLEQKNALGAQRNEPFCLHLSSPPGYGKSLIANKLVRDVFGVTDAEVYSRATNSEHWNGFHNQKVVIYDEFLVGEERKEEIATEFLLLKSSGLFICPMASVDDITVGIKGTTAAPVGILTMNNTKYHHAPTLNSGALQRRCNMNLRLRVAPGVPVNAQGRPILTPALIEQGIGKWVQFGILPIVGVNTRATDDRTVWMDYDTVLESIRAKKAEHEALAEAISKIYGIVVDEEETPTMMMTKILQESSEIPTTPLGVIDTIRTFIAQGRPDRKKRPTKTIDAKTRKGVYRTEITEKGEDGPGVWLDQKEMKFGELATVKPVLGKRHCHYCRECDIKSAAHKTCNGTIPCRACKKEMPVMLPREKSDDDYETPYGSCDETPERERNPVYPTQTYEKIANGTCVIDGCIAKNFDDSWTCPSHYVKDIEELRSLPFWESYHTRNQWRHDVEHLPMDLKAIRKQYANHEIGGHIVRHKFELAIFAILAVFVVINLIRKMICPNEDEIQYCAQSARAAKTTQQPARRRGVTKGAMKFKAQGPQIPFLTLSCKGATMNAIGLKEKYVLTFAHALERHVDHVNAGGEIFIEYLGKGYSCTIIPSTIAYNGDNDWVIFQIVNKSMPNFPDNVKNFISESELKQVTGAFDVSVTSNTTTRYGPARLKKNLTYAANKGAKELEEYCAYRMPTEVGDCGSVVRIATGMLSSKIIGLHVAGTDSKAPTPVGACNIITREELQDGMSSDGKFDDDDQEFTFIQQSLQDEDYPNLVKFEYVPASQQVHMSSMTKIERNLISDLLPYESVKAPAILSRRDPRVIDKINDDPISKNIADTLSTTHTVVDEEPVRSIYETMYMRYNEIPFPAGRRRLNFEEACCGVPGLLCSVRVATSPGWPLVLERTKSGKKDFVWFDEQGDFHYDPRFRERVEALCEKMRRGEEPEHIWLGYMKDELVSPEKIANCRTRTIYASSLIATVAFRMAFGCILIAFNNNWEKTPLSIGANQYSYDMQVFYDYLNEDFGGENYIAGDYKSFDKRCHPTFRKFAYKLLTDLARTYPEDPVTDAEIEFFIKHETESPAQLGPFRFWTKSNHMSGCFYTTIVNCLVNEGYFRWAFARLNPALIYDEHVRAKFLGDDHIAKASETCKFDQVSIARVLEMLGQEYTSDRKGEEIVPFRKFEEITFLGAHPMKVEGIWAGALKKTTLEETVLWTRDGNVTLLDTLKQLLEMSSIWDREYHEKYRASIRTALFEKFLPGIVLPSWGELRKIVAERTASRGMLFYSF